MPTTQAVFLVLLFPGVLCLIAGMMLTRVHWRADIPAYGLKTRFLDVTLHPERYASEDAPLSVIRGLSALGGVLLACAVGVMAYEIVRVVLKG